MASAAVRPDGAGIEDLPHLLPLHHRIIEDRVLDDLHAQGERQPGMDQSRW